MLLVFLVSVTDFKKMSVEGCARVHIDATSLAYGAMVRHLRKNCSGPPRGTESAQKPAKSQLVVERLEHLPLTT